jgi:hypothetical protein
MLEASHPFNPQGRELSSKGACVCTHVSQVETLGEELGVKPSEFVSTLELVHCQEWKTSGEFCNALLRV